MNNILNNAWNENNNILFLIVQTNVIKFTWINYVIILLVWINRLYIEWSSN